MSLLVVAYDADTHGLRKFDTVESLKDLRPSETVWIDIVSTGRDEIAGVAAHFGLHELSVEDCVTPGHFPKIDDYGQYLFMVFRALKTGEEIEKVWETLLADQPESDTDPARQGRPRQSENIEDGKLTRKLAVFLSEKYVVTYRRHERPWIQAVAQQVLQSADKYLAQGTDVVAHRLIDALTDRFQHGLNFFEQIITRAEDSSLESSHEFSMSQILELKRALTWLRQITRDQRLVTSKLAFEGFPCIRPKQRRYFKDIDDHVLEIQNVIEKQIDSVGGVRDAYFASVNVRLNDTMRILAIITTIAAPLNILVGLYGMNFEFMPLLHHQAGFWLMLALIVIISGLMLCYFRRRRWL
jgi:magnesium transporter